ncbi:MAG: BlaI/MecI/CopY family transcriptional regulator [Phycisphaerae bacterium]|nr:BlaI/MecI/CopY family transcriptional regulator [Phycisphaerae bacterium]NUQ45046.1 BlaI/MecI/CopY family transcriptional regulator [Phycisphaerae bacterium]
MAVERQFELGDAELEVLKALWDAGPATVRQVLAWLHHRGRRVAYTTVLTVLTRLEQKGFVTSDKSGLAYVYRAAVTRERVTRKRVKALMQQLFDGAAAPLVLQLIQNERFTKGEIQELAKLIEDLDAARRGRRT